MEAANSEIEIHYNDIQSVKYVRFELFRLLIKYAELRKNVVNTLNFTPEIIDIIIELIKIQTEKIKEIILSIQLLINENRTNNLCANVLNDINEKIKFYTEDHQSLNELYKELVNNYY